MNQEGVIVKRIGFRFKPERSLWLRLHDMFDMVKPRIRRDVAVGARSYLMGDGDIPRQVTRGVWGRLGADARYRTHERIFEEIVR